MQIHLGRRRVVIASGFSESSRPLTMAQTVKAICELIDLGRPTYVITANTHYAMLSDQHVDLRAINDGAALIVADGAPLVWTSRWKNARYPSGSRAPT